MLITRKQSVSIFYYDICWSVSSFFLTGSSLPYTSPIPLLCLKICLKKYIYFHRHVIKNFPEISWLLSNFSRFTKFSDNSGFSRIVGSLCMLLLKQRACHSEWRKLREPWEVSVDRRPHGCWTYAAARLQVHHTAESLVVQQRRRPVAWWVSSTLTGSGGQFLSTGWRHDLPTRIQSAKTLRSIAKLIRQKTKDTVHPVKKMRTCRCVPGWQKSNDVKWSTKLKSEMQQLHSADDQWRSNAVRGPGSTVIWGPSIPSAGPKD